MKTSILSIALVATAAVVAFTGCDNSSSVEQSALPNNTVASSKLADILSLQPKEAVARYGARNPQQVLEFFEVTPGMAVVEALPGGGWYTKILLPYLGSEGQLIGADYAVDMYPKFGFFSDELIESKKTWITTWTADAEAWRNDNSAGVSAYQMNSMPKSLDGTADAVLFIRALHNLARFEHDGEYLTKTLSEAYRVLKPGGIVGVVQHHVAEEVADSWADGSRGYLKESFVIKSMQDAGFEYVSSIDINQNPADMPKESDIVWRLPPSLSTSRDNPELQAEYLAIGESNRMTLKFRKP